VPTGFMRCELNRHARSSDGAEAMLEFAVFVV
jgi:hypothetical protein